MLKKHKKILNWYRPELVNEIEPDALFPVLRKLELVSPLQEANIKKVSSSRTIVPANKEPFLNQLAHVIRVNNLYRSTSTCFHVYSREYIFLPVVTSFV